MPSLSLRERLAGGFVLAAERARERPMTLDLVVTIERATPRIVATVAGEIEAPSLARRGPVAGAASFDVAQRTQRYLLDFTAEDGSSANLRLERRIEFANLYTSATVLTGEILDREGRELAKCVLRFDARSDLRRLLSSIRVS